MALLNNYCHLLKPIMIIFVFADTIFIAHSLGNLYIFYGSSILYLLIRFVWKIRRVNLTQGIFLGGCSFFLYTTLRELMFRHMDVLLPPHSGTGLMHLDLAVGATTMISVLTFTFCMAIAIFITTREEIENSIEARHRLAADNAYLMRMDQMKADLIATVTHETMTPLSVLSAYSEIIAKELRFKNIDEQTAKDLDIISEEVQHIAWLIDELSNNTKMADNRLTKTRISLVKLLEVTARMYKPILNRAGTLLNIEISDNLPDIYACSGEITQVLFNLMQNAHNHTERGSIDITLNCEEGFLKITISDTGNGIKPELLPHVFDRGVSGKDKNGKKGSGLGLVLCKEIIESHGGTIEIESEYGNGTKIWFTLPVYKCEGI